MSDSKKITEDEIFRKLRKEKATTEIQNILFSFNVDLKDMIERIEELEKVSNQKLTGSSNQKGKKPKLKRNLLFEMNAKK